MIISAVISLLFYANIFMGEKNGHLSEGQVEFAGGVSLILIGLEILSDHTLFQTVSIEWR